MFLLLQIIELEQARELRDKSEMDEIIDNARKEKDLLEAQIADLQEHLSRSRCEVNKLKEQLRQLQEECKVRNLKILTLRILLIPITLQILGLPIVYLFLFHR